MNILFCFKNLSSFIQGKVIPYDCQTFDFYPNISCYKYYFIHINSVDNIYNTYLTQNHCLSQILILKLY